jgi:hypothetical protein
MNLNSDQADTPTQVEAESPDTEFQHENLAEGLKEDKLIEIGDQCKRGFEADLQSRSDWEDDLDDWIALARQVREPKS